MNGKHTKQLVAAIERQIEHWQKLVERWAEDAGDVASSEMPALAPLVEGQLHSLRGYDAELAAQYDWAWSC